MGINQMSRKNIIFLLAVSTSLILGVWLGAWYVGVQTGLMQSVTNQPLADLFSSVNALFAGLAFCGVILTVYLQIQELQDTRQELIKTAEANRITANCAQEGVVVELFRTYCSEYFQHVKDSSMNVLIPAMASREYFEYVVSRFFVSEQRALSQGAWQRIRLVSRYADFDAFKVGEQKDRYKLDELLNFFTILAHQRQMQEIIGRCDFSYSWWRPMFWMIAIAQDNRYRSHASFARYDTAPYLKSVVQKLDNAYRLTPIDSVESLIELIKDHPKLQHHYKLDPQHLNITNWVQE